MARTTSVLIVGGGPAGLSMSLLLSKLGVENLLVDQRPTTSTHPRGRLYDVVTLELFRHFGLQSEIEATGLGPEWTAYNRWFDNLSGTEIARAATPSFHSVRSSKSPAMPVMSSQDWVEKILYDSAKTYACADVRFNTQAMEPRQNGEECRTTLVDLATGKEELILSEYVIAADGVNSSIRECIDCSLSGERFDAHFQDVLFHADLSKWFQNGEGGVVLVAHEMGGGAFQAINGRTKWRAQIANFPKDEKITHDYCMRWIKSAVGAEEDINIEIESIRPWQFIAGTASAFRKDRIFLVGDAAHAFIPTGGLGSNAGLVGARNLAWKMAYVLNGYSPSSILDTYQSEHLQVVNERIDLSKSISRLTAPLLQAFFSGSDLTEPRRQCQRWGDYDGLILGYELSSDLCLPDAADPPAVPDPTRNYVPIVRAGRRAPHIWLDANETQSILDVFGLNYVVIMREGDHKSRWWEAVDRVAQTGFPLSVQTIPDDVGHGLYASDEISLVRPDGIVAGRAIASETNPDAFLSAGLPRVINLG